MFFTELLVALAVALLISAIFAAAFGATGPWSGFWAFFLIILLVTWAAGLWARPFGPTLLGVYWAPYLLFGLVAALLLAAATPPDRSRDAAARYRRDEIARARGGRTAGEPAADGPRDEEDLVVEGATVALGVFFWILLLVLLTAVVLGYF